MAILCLPVLSAQASPTSDALVIGIQSSKTTSLNPLFPVERDMLSIFDLMYDSLITIDDNYQPQAGLAESWTQTGNGRTWTFTLRQGVLFSDGTEMTANDVVATANYIISCAKDTNLTNKGYYANLRYFVKEIKARDNYTVEVRADRQYYGVLYAMTFPVLPASALESANPPGTGAYMITAFTPYSNGTKGSMTLSLNPYYSGKPPQFKNLYFDLYGKDADVVNAYQYSNVDAIFSRSLSIAQYKSSTNTLAITYRTNQLECLLLNNYLGSMTNNMRTAIRSCINIDSIVQSVYMSMVDRTNTPMIQGTWMYNSNLSSYFQVDLNKARQLLEGTNLVGTPFAAQFPAAQLHWLIADRSGALTLESMADGMHIWENPVGVLTNNPPFPVQLLLLNNYMGVTAQAPENRFSDRIALKPYSRGMGGMGLPGDLSSASRFVRVAFTKLNAVSGTGESESVNQFFHILGSVEQVRGCCAVGDRYEITQYTSCCNATRGIYYYTSYENSQITAIDLHRTDLFAPTLFRYPRHPEWNARWEN